MAIFGGGGKEKTLTTQLQKSKGEKKFDLWSSIQASKVVCNDSPSPPYVHPLLQRSSRSLSQRSLEVCTESLGSETGSDGFSDIDDYFGRNSSDGIDEEETEEELAEPQEEGCGIEQISSGGRKQLAAVNYHCSIGRRSPARSFPPPLPSLSRRDGPCVQMRPHRRDGRLIVEAVSVPSQNYLHCHRQDGRLLLTFIETTFQEIYPESQDPATQFHQQQQEAEEEEEDKEVVEVVEVVEVEVEEEQEGEEEEEEEDMVEEEEVEVVDRGIVVEVKVSRGMKVHKSSLVINKFVSGTPLDNKVEPKEEEHDTNTTTNHDKIAVVAASPMSIEEVDGWGSGGQKKQQATQDNKLLFTSKKLMNRQALLHQVRRCSYQQRPLFIWERCCIATT